MRISNIDTLSALFDRLICENIKRFFFNNKEDWDSVKHQDEIILEIKSKITLLFIELHLDLKYKYISEKRTFNIEAIVETLDELIHNDINIGEADRARLVEATSNDPNVSIMTREEKRLRVANEARADNKNKIDSLLGDLFNAEAED